MAILGVVWEVEVLCALALEEGELDVVGEKEEGVGVGHDGDDDPAPAPSTRLKKQKRGKQKVNREKRHQ